MIGGALKMATAKLLLLRGVKVVPPHLQKRFDGLERDDDKLDGIRRDIAEQINAQLYYQRQLHGAMLAKCPGKQWRFALG